MSVEDRLRDAFREAAPHVRTSADAWRRVAEGMEGARRRGPGWSRRLAPVLVSLVVLAGILAAAAIRNTDGETDHVLVPFPEGGTGDRLLPTVEPEGLRFEAMELVDGEGRQFVDPEPVVVFGEPGLSDPLGGRFLIVAITDADAVLLAPEITEVAGKPALIDAEYSVNGLVEGPSAAWVEGGTGLVAWGYGVTADDLRAAIAGVTIDASGAPVGADVPGSLVEVGRLGTRWNVPAGSTRVFPVDEAAEPGSSYLQPVVVDAVTPEEAVALRALLKRDAEATYRTAASIGDDRTYQSVREVDVAGRAAWTGTIADTLRALVVPGSPGVVVFTEGNAAGQGGEFLSDEQLVTLADGLRRVSDDEFARRSTELNEADRVAQRDALLGGEPPLFEGELAGAERLVALSRDEVCLGDQQQATELQRYRLHLHTCASIRATVTAALTDGSEEPPAPPIAWGVVASGVARVEIRLPSGEVVVPELHPVTSKRAGAVFAVPVAQRTSQAEAVAFDEQGRELARAPVLGA